MPVSQKPRKQRHRTPPKKATRPQQSAFRRILVAMGIAVVAFAVALLAVFSPQRQKQNQAEKTSPTLEVTTTLLDPAGGVPCPKAEGEGKRTEFPPAGPPACLTIGHTYTARFTTDAGAFVVELDPSKAPKAVNVFVFLARYHFYDGLTFHKAVPGFFVQSGDPVAPGVTGPGFTFDDQLPKKGDYIAGSVAMANQKVGANGSQFLIMVAPAPTLAPNYPLFGRVVDGLDTVKKIANDGDAKGNPKVVHQLLRVVIDESS